MLPKMPKRVRSSGDEQCKFLRPIRRRRHVKRFVPKKTMRNTGYKPKKWVCTFTNTWNMHNIHANYAIDSSISLPWWIWTRMLLFWYGAVLKENISPTSGLHLWRSSGKPTKTTSILASSTTCLVGCFIVWVIFAVPGPDFNHPSQSHVEEYCLSDFSNILCESLDIIRHQLVWQDFVLQLQPYEAQSSLKVDLAHGPFHTRFAPCVWRQAAQWHRFQPSIVSYGTLLRVEPKWPAVLQQLRQMHQRTRQLMTSEGLRGCLSPTTGHSCDHPLHYGLCNQLLWDYNPTNNVMGWVDFRGLCHMLSLRTIRFPLSGFPRKKNDIAPTVGLQFPTCFATPKYAGCFFGSTVFIWSERLCGVRNFITIWE